MDDLLDIARQSWEETLATQSGRLALPGRTVRNDWGRGEQVGAPTEILVPCVVIGPLSTPREVVVGDQTSALADFEVRLPWRIQDEVAVMSDAQITVEGEGVLQTYRVLGLDRGRPRALFLSCFCTREERRA